MIFDFLFPILFFLLLPFLWLIREIKAIDFWLYEWQQKDYRAGALIGHLRTSYGRKLLLNKLVFLKAALILVFVLGIPYILDTFDPGDLLHLDILLGFSAIGATFLVYAAEGIKAARDFFGRTLRVPVPAKKVIILRLLLFSITVLWFFSLGYGVLVGIPDMRIPVAVGILLYDLLTPGIVLAAAFMIQPFAALGRNQMIR